MSNALLDLLADRGHLVADGAMGTNLFALGLETGDSPELWNVEQAEKVASVHRGFLEAGSDIVLTNSFGGTEHRLKLHGAQDRVRELNAAAARICRGAVDRWREETGKTCLVAGSMGPTGELFAPLGPLTPETGEADNFGEAYVGVNWRRLNGYAYYGFGSTLQDDDEYIYTELNTELDVLADARLRLHVGGFFGMGDFYDLFTEQDYIDYGASFIKWLASPKIQPPYNSYGNGAAMRVSPAGWLYDNLEVTLEVARLVTDVTHNHPEGIKGAQATALAIFLARQGEATQNIRESIKQRFGYDLDRSVDQCREEHIYNEFCQICVPDSIVCALDSKSYEDAVRNAVSLGGDADTLGAIAGSIAEVIHGIPDDLIAQAQPYLDESFMPIIEGFYERVG